MGTSVLIAVLFIFSTLRGQYFDLKYLDTTFQDLFMSNIVSSEPLNILSKISIFTDFLVKTSLLKD